jgi:endonuclease/exonuclease/phosphatase family metal-dependent hydrolase
MALPIRVATYNLYLGADLSTLLGEVPRDQLTLRVEEVQRQLAATAFPARAAAIARALVGAKVDLVGLQEVCTWRRDGQPLWDYSRILLDAFDELGEPYDVVADQASFRGAGEVQRDGRSVPMELQGRNVVIRRRAAGIEVEEARSGSFGAALTLPLMGAAQVSIERGWCAARCVAGGARFTFVNTHTEAYDPASRNSQRSELLQVLPEGPLALVGDFNATPDEVGMPADLRDAWVEAGRHTDPGSGATCCQSADLFNQESRLDERIDYVWVRELGVESCIRIGVHAEDCTERGQWPSDHAGVVATLLLEE